MLHNTLFESSEARFLRFYKDGVEGRMPIGDLSKKDRLAFRLGWKNSGRFGPDLMELHEAKRQLADQRIII